MEEQSDTRNTIKEGKATVILPSGVFYNKVQEFNRDLTISVINTYFSNEKDENIPKHEPLISRKHKQPDCLNILEALAASGLRSMRFGLEIKHNCKVVTNDIDIKAYESIKNNIKLNQVDDIVFPSCMDAADLILQNKGLYNVIDIDPYGSSMDFIDAAVQSVSDGGLLCFTCTDMAVLCGSKPEVCYSRYNSMPLNSKSCHEMALRILIRSVVSSAAKYRKCVVPLLSVYVDFYIRIFVSVYSSPSNANSNCLNVSSVYNCFGCSSHWFQSVVEIQPHTNDFKKFCAPRVNENIPSKGYCPFCDTNVRIGGPIWTGPLYSPSFVKKLIFMVERDHSYLGTSRRIQGMLTLISEELLDVPLFYEISRISSTVGCPTIPTIKIRSALLNAGYRVSESHVSPNSLKTNAPLDFLWDVMRMWASENSSSSAKRHCNEVAMKILSVPIKHSVDWSSDSYENPASKRDNMLRYQFKPFPNWGPQSRPC